MKKGKLSVYLSFLLRHKPEELGLDMDRHGWVEVRELMDRINAQGCYTVTMPILEAIVAEDRKGRYRFNEDRTRIKACQGHTICWVEPELERRSPPTWLYHGTTRRAWSRILSTGAISRMTRHAVHMQSEEAKAWLSACRWKGEVPVVLKIDARRMEEQGHEFMISENQVWFTGSVPVEFVCQVLERE